MCSNKLKYQKLIVFSFIFIFYQVWGQNNEDTYVDKVVTIIDSLPQQSVGGLSVDALGYIYSADFADQVWRINPYTKKAEVFAQGIYGASGNSIDSQGNLYQASIYGNYISKIDRNGSKEKFADSLLAGPVGITINSKNELFVCNCYDGSIAKINPEGKTKIFVRSNYFHCPNGITVDNKDNLYVVSFNNNDIIKISPKGEVSHFAKTPDKLGNGHITIVNNFIYVTGFHGHRIYRVGLNGKNLIVLAGTGTRGSKDGDAQSSMFSYPNGIASSPDGKTLYVNEMHGELANPLLQPGKGSIKAIKLISISDLLQKRIGEKGVKGLQDYYRELKKRRFRTVDTSNEVLNLGDSYLLTGQHDIAEIILKMNIESYPKEYWNYIFLARNMYLLGKKDEIRKYYKKAMELRPDNERINQRLLNYLNDE